MAIKKTTRVKFFQGPDGGFLETSINTWSENAAVTIISVALSQTAYSFSALVTYTY